MENNSIGNGKADGLIAYLDSLKEKGRAPSATVTSLKTAASKIFQSTDGDKWQEVDVRNLDIEDYMARFKNLTLGKYNSDSYNTYQARLQRAVDWYSNFLSIPGWSPATTERKSSANKDSVKKQGKGNTSKESTEVCDGEQGANGNPDGTAPSKLVAFPFPLTTGELATLYLPAKLTRNDGYRLAKFLEALVSDGTSMLAGGSDEGA